MNRIMPDQGGDAIALHRVGRPGTIVHADGIGAAAKLSRDSA
ncbi:MULTISPECIES: hypothetical protein [unclassified Mesorhizobium]